MILQGVASSSQTFGHLGERARVDDRMHRRTRFVVANELSLSLPLSQFLFLTLSSFSTSSKAIRSDIKPIENDDAIAGRVPYRQNALSSGASSSKADCVPSLVVTVFTEHLNGILSRGPLLLLLLLLLIFILLYRSVRMAGRTASDTMHTRS